MILVDSDEKAVELSEKLKHSTLIVLDVETHKTEQYYNKELLGVAIGIPRGIDLSTYYVLPGQLPLVKDVLNRCEWVGHNLKFDLEICYQNGLDFQGKIYDTQIIIHLVDENQPSYELDWLGQKFLNERKMDMKPFEKIFLHWNKIPAQIMGEYACKDLELTWRLFLKFYPQLREQQLEEVFDHSMEYVRSLQLLIRGGIKVDRQLVSDLSRKAGVRLSELESQLAADSKGVIRNPTSPKQVQKYLYHDLKLPVKSRTAKGAPAVDNAALAALVEDKPELEDSVGKLIEYRQRSKAKSTWYDGFLNKMGDRDYIHPGLKQHGTKTGRLSCAEPNLQQIPRDSGRVKRIFLDDGEFRLVEFDYSQIELRIGAWYAHKFHDSTMYNLYLEGQDIHLNTANMIGSIDVLGYSEGRYVGKTGNFLWIYQGGAKRLQQMLWKEAKMRVSLEQCQLWTEAFHRNYPGFQRANLYAAERCQANGFVKMWNGRKRRIQEKNERGQIKFYVAFNSIVQGGAGQVLMYAINELASLQRSGAPFRLCSTVHDSVWCYLPENRLEEGLELIKKVMRAPAEKQFELPFEVDTKFYREYREKES